MAAVTWKSGTITMIIATFMVLAMLVLVDRLKDDGSEIVAEDTQKKEETKAEMADMGKTYVKGVGNVSVTKEIKKPPPPKKTKVALKSGMLAAVENAKAGVMPPGVGPEYSAQKKKTVEEVDVNTKLARRYVTNTVTVGVGV